MSKKFLIGLTIGVFAGALFTWLIFAISSDEEKTKIVESNTMTCPVCLICKPEKVEPPEPEPEEIDPEKILPPPRFTISASKSYETSPPGEVKIQWQPVPGAKRYKIYVYSEGQEEPVKETSIRGDIIYLQNIPYVDEQQPFLTYQVRLSTINQAGEEGEQGAERDLKIWKNHGVRLSGEPIKYLSAPQIKSIKVED